MAGLATLLASGVLGWSMLVAGATADGARGPRTIVVSGDGTGDATTIADGVAMARDGDTVLVGPGTYREHVDVTTDVHIRGLGLRDSVIVEAPDDPSHAHDGSPRSVAVTFRGSFGSIGNLTVIGRRAGRGISVEAASAPTISNVVIDAMGGGWTGENVAIWWSGGSNGVLRGSTVSGIVGMVNAGTAPVIERNRLPRTCIVVRPDGRARQDQPRPVIRLNVVGGCPMGVLIQVQAGSPLVEGNDLVLDRGTAVSLAGSGGIVRANTIHDSGTGVSIANPRGPVGVTDNLIRDTTIGLAVFNGRADTRIVANDLRHNALALNLAGGEHPAITDNTLCGNAADVKMVPAGHDAPSLDGNGGCQASGWLPGA